MDLYYKIKALYKKFMSYRKKTWEIEDYPLKFRHNKNTEEIRFGKPVPWVVQVVNWWTLSGIGNTKEEAYENLKFHFNHTKENEPLPRPGKHVPIQFADSTEIDKLEDLAKDFLDKIMEIDIYDCILTDESSVFEFGEEENEVIEKINSAYNLNLTEIGNGNILKILKLIKESK